MKLIPLALAAFACIIQAIAIAQEQPSFTASSKAQGAPFDLVVTESARYPAKSYLEVPGFHERSAPGARWLMCAYTALAAQRGFTHWSVVYPAQGSSRVVVGFSNSLETAPSELLGEDYAKSRLLGEGMMPVQRLVSFCGIKQ